MVFDKDRCRSILYQMHTGAEHLQSFMAMSIGSHIGINKTIECISTRIFWPDITGDVKVFCKMCRMCQLSKDITIQKTSTVMHPIPIPIKVMSQIGVDLMHMSGVDDKNFMIMALTISLNMWRWVPYQTKRLPLMCYGYMKTYSAG